MVNKYFLDTYALVEIINGNKNYLKVLDKELYTGIFNLYELYYNLLKEKSEEEAKNYFFQFRRFVIPFSNETIFLASKFKMEHKKKNISYVDALGYTISLEKDIKFVTGDKEFETFENVEFIK